MCLAGVTSGLPRRKLFFCHGVGVGCDISSNCAFSFPKNIPKVLKHNKITSIYRIGKYIIADLKNDYSIIFHLGMSGRMRILKTLKFLKKKHDHFILKTKKYILIFNDTRKFGFIEFFLIIERNRISKGFTL